jgi:hypothetical protein
MAQAVFFALVLNSQQGATVAFYQAFLHQFLL